MKLFRITGNFQSYWFNFVGTLPSIDEVPNLNDRVDMINNILAEEYDAEWDCPHSIKNRNTKSLYSSPNKVIFNSNQGLMFFMLRWAK